MKRRYLSPESAMLPRLQARYSYQGPMATKLETMNWIQRAVRRTKRMLAKARTK